MKTFLLKWRGTAYIRKVEAETLAKAKIKFCEHDNVNALLASDRIAVIRKPTQQDYMLAEANA